MNFPSNQIDVKRGCSVYSSMVQKVLNDLFRIEVDSQNSAESVPELGPNEDLHFSILFTGQVYGEFLFAMSRKTAVKMLGYQEDGKSSEELFATHRTDIMDTLKEVINVAAGTTLGEFKTVFPDLSITPPKAIEGRVSISTQKIERARLTHISGELSCYIYVDYMRLDVKELMEKDRRLNRAKSEFLSNMSHEIRTPLNGMIGMLDILRASPMSAVQIEQFDIVYRSGEFLLSLISDILEFSKIESGRLEVEKNPFDLRLAIESVVESLSSVVLGKGLRFNIDLDSQINGMYLGDQTRLKQVLVNLIGNATKFTPTGSITVSARKTESSTIQFGVRDTGIGIPKAKLATIFESFAQVDVSDNRKYGGSGLGLTISKAIVEAMGGRIRVESEEANGTEFFIDIPLAKAIVPEGAVRLSHLTNSLVHVVSREQAWADSIRGTLAALNPHCGFSTPNLASEFSASACDFYLVDFETWSSESQDWRDKFTRQIGAAAAVVFVARPNDLDSAAKLQTQFQNFTMMSLPVTSGRLASALSPKTSAGPKKDIGVAVASSGQSVLVVEDNQVNQVVISTMLRKLGYRVEIANDGAEAFESLKAGKSYSLILMDCQMPVMNGYEATKAIRTLESTAGTHVPIVALTANAFRETKETCFECGMDDFATKPIKFDALKSVIQRALERKAAG